MFLENKVSTGIIGGWKNIVVFRFKMVEMSTSYRVLKIVKAVLFSDFSL